jgi:hypothetical protein
MGIWDTKMNDEATVKSDFPVAEPGEYFFQVEKVTGKEYTPKPTSKIGKCAVISLQLRVETPKGDVRVFDRLYSDPTTIWKMTAFAKSIGAFKSGMTPGDLLKAAEGGIGKAYIKLVPATNEYPEKNEVGRYIEKEEPKKVDSEDLPF